MNKTDESYARIANLSQSYLKISVDNYLAYSKCRKELEKIENEISDDLNLYFHEKHSSLRDETGTYYVISVIFCSMFLESYIYDFGARNTSDKYISKYLDKLDTMSKWVIIPKIISGVEIDRSKKSFEFISKLISARNKLIHWKSKRMTFETLEKNKDEKIYNLVDLEKVFISIKDIFAQLDDGQEVKSHSFYISYIDEKSVANNV
ncbi:hypothetical protein LV716_13865 [Flagellimonas sp. HMM57]|uniref:hypothetical protein n=1 Tax=unclassified Flagellimonas TaxID=2644544 RepID=UPI0013D76032|nr:MULTISPECIES: hypothetical protein [unclassified Flagellimonas]UII75334.1 hypothetical protein LV716_13865 [Flagellimonas sp. HMM57]